MNWHFEAAPSTPNLTLPIIAGVIFIVLFVLVLIVFRGKRIQDTMVGLTILAFAFAVVSLMIITNTQTELDKAGYTKSGNLQIWMEDAYGVKLTDQGAYELLQTAYSSRDEPYRSVTIDYKGEQVAVRLVDSASEDNAYTVVRVMSYDDLTEPLDDSR